MEDKDLKTVVYSIIGLSQAVSVLLKHTRNDLPKGTFQFIDDQLQRCEHVMKKVEEELQEIVDKI